MDECSLGAADREVRGREFQEVAAGALVHRTRDELDVRLTYRRSEETEAALRELIRREGECCPFLDFDLSSGPEGLTLRIAAPPSGAAVLDAIYERSAPAPA